jgi:hypothetical protein
VTRTVTTNGNSFLFMGCNQPTSTTSSDINLATVNSTLTVTCLCA